MKKLIIPLCLFCFLSCSTEENDADEEMCCDKTISEIKEGYTRIYEMVQNDPDATEQQKIESQEYYERRMEDPCTFYKNGLEASGASCSNP